MKEYKILTQKWRFFSGTFDPKVLKEEINILAAKGWKVTSMTTDNSGAFGKSKELIVLFEREQD